MCLSEGTYRVRLLVAQIDPSKTDRAGHNGGTIVQVCEARVQHELSMQDEIRKSFNPLAESAHIMSLNKVPDLDVGGPLAGSEAGQSASHPPDSSPPPISSEGPPKLKPSLYLEATKDEGATQHGSYLIQRDRTTKAKQGQNRNAFDALMSKDGRESEEPKAGPDTKELESTESARTVDSAGWERQR